MTAVNIFISSFFLIVCIETWV